MSYCRFGENGSDLYIINNSSGHLECYCGTQGKQNFKTRSRKQMILHIEEHFKNGQIVHPKAIRRLLHEIKTIGDKIKPPHGIRELPMMTDEI